MQDWIPGVTPLSLAVALGSVKHCLLRAAKFTLFDATRELAYVPLEQETQMRGKACDRWYRLSSGTRHVIAVKYGTSGFLGELHGRRALCGGLALGFTFLWLGAVRSFYRLFERRAQTENCQ